MSKLSCDYLRRPKKRGRPQGSSSQPEIQYSRSVEGRISPDLAVGPSTAGLEPPSSTQSNVPTAYKAAPIEARHQDLVQSPLFAAPGSTFEVIAKCCINLFVQNVFPLKPLFHEASLRRIASLQHPHTHTSRLDKLRSITYSGVGNADEVTTLREYTELVSVCAATAFLLPPDVTQNAFLVG